MSNGPKLGMHLGQRQELRQHVYLAPLMTPRLRRSREQRPDDDDDDDDDATPWRRVSEP